MQINQQHTKVHKEITEELTLSPQHEITKFNSHNPNPKYTKSFTLINNTDTYERRTNLKFLLTEKRDTESYYIEVTNTRNKKGEPT